MTDNNEMLDATQPPPHTSEEQAPMEAPKVHYVYAVAMLDNGELRVITELPFEAERRPSNVDVAMTAQYVADFTKSQLFGNV